jgi:hypothetical protein
MRLKDRNRQIPGGMFIYVPETRWKSADWSSFDSIVDQLIAHRRGNPALAAKHKWSTDRAVVESEVDAFVSNVCAQMGYDSFIIGNEGSPPKKLQPPSQQEVSALAAGAAKVKTVWQSLQGLGAWLGSGEPAVEAETSASRGARCADCTLNVKGDFSSWLTKPAVDVIKKQLEVLHERKLSSPSDDKLGVCDACLCNLRMKIHAPMKYIQPYVSDTMLDRLRQAKSVHRIEQPFTCWIVEALTAS